MKTNLLKFILAVLTLGLLGSCSKINERIDGLDKRVYDLENSRIASIEQQITAINTSINDLKAADAAINGKIGDLKTTAEALQTLIDALKEADKALGQKDDALEARIAVLEGQVNTINGKIKTLEDADKAINLRIDELKTYVNEELANAKDWATETFATLTQYQQTADDLAALSVTVTGISTTLAGVQTSISGLDTKIDGIDAALRGKITEAKTELEGNIAGLKTELEGKIADAITASETSIKTWISTLLEGYYTAAEVDAEISALNTVIEAAKDNANEGIDSLATELTTLKTAVDTVKANIRTEYKNAISTAINKLDGEIRGALKDSILAVNGRIEALDTRVTALEGRIQAVEGKVDEILAMIQSVSITPAYSDGSVEAVNGILTLKCIVSPAEALNGMESLKDSLLIYADSVKVKTKATTHAYMEIEVSEASVLDAAQGAITLTADISEYLPKGEDKALTVAVNIKNGISNFTTEFVPVTVTPKSIETVADVLATVAGGFPEDKSGGNTPVAPSNAWTNGNGSSAFIYSSALILQHDTYTYGLLKTTVTKENNCYTASISYGNLEFNMTNGILTSFKFIPDPTKPNAADYVGTYDTEKTTLTMKKGDTEYDWNHITISIKGIDIVSGKYYFGKSTVENAAGDFIELTAEQIGSINSAEGLHIVKKDLYAETEYKTVLVVSNSAGYSKTIVATENSGEAPPPM